MSRVFIIQKQHRWDSRREELVPKFDVEPARVFGDFVWLLGPTASPFNPESVIGEMSKKLQDFTDQDHLLLIGNPCLIGWAVAIAADVTGGPVRLLQWSGKERRYISIESDVFVDSSE